MNSSETGLAHAYFPAQDPCDKALRTVSSLFKGKEHQPLLLWHSPLWFCDLNPFTFLPAATTPIVCKDRPLHTSPFTSLQSQPFSCVEELEPHPHHSGWKRQTTASVTRLVTKIQVMIFRGCVLFLVGIFVATVISCNEKYKWKQHQSLKKHWDCASWQLKICPF